MPRKTEIIDNRKVDPLVRLCDLQEGEYFTYKLFEDPETHGLIIASNISAGLSLRSSAPGMITFLNTQYSTLGHALATTAVRRVKATLTIE